MYQSWRRPHGRTQMTGAGFVVPPTGGGSSLLTGLMASYKLDDTVDASGRGNTLTNHSATFSTGKIGNAAYLVRASTQFLSATSSADLQIGPSSHTIAAWVYLTTKAARMQLVTKDSDVVAREYVLLYDTADDRFHYVLYGTPANSDCIANTFGSPTTGVWNLIIASYDSVGQVLNMKINNNAESPQSTAGNTPSTPGAAQFQLGARNYSGFEDYLDGRLDNVGIWNRVLTGTEHTNLWNSGAGLEYPY